MADEKTTTRGSEFLDSLAGIVAQSLGELVAMDGDTAAAVADQVAADVAAKCGGSLLYIGTGYRQKVLSMHRRMYADFTGSNQAELARRYGVSIVWAYKILKRMRKQEIAERQLTLFEGEDGADDEG